MTDPDATPVADAPETPIDIDVRCIRCGYNLRGMTPSGVCPECGDDVGPSLVGDRLIDADLDWLRRIVRGQKLLALGMTAPILMAVGSIALMIAISIIQSQGNVTVPRLVEDVVSWITLGVMLAGLASAVAGAFMVTSLEPRESETEKVTSDRMRARGAMIATFVAGGFWFGSRYFPVEVATWLTPLLKLLAVVAFTLAIVASLRVLTGYARRIPDADLVRRGEKTAGVFRWLLPTVVAIDVASDLQVTQAAAGTVLEPWIQGVGLVVGCLGGVLVVALFFYALGLIGLMGRFKRGLALVEVERTAAG